MSTLYHYNKACERNDQKREIILDNNATKVAVDTLDRLIENNQNVAATSNAPSTATNRNIKRANSIQCKNRQKRMVTFLRMLFPKFRLCL